MAKKNPTAEYDRGFRAAYAAIADERAFWILTDEEDSEDTPEHIDPQTGLPYLSISGDPSTIGDYVRGYNDTILQAYRAGQIKTDFRPLLMSRAEIVRAMKKTNLGVLSLENPKIAAPGGEFTLEIKIPKPSKRPPKNLWITFRNCDEEWPQWELYDEDELFAVGVGREGRVVIIKNDDIYYTFDVRTTQELDRYEV